MKKYVSKAIVNWLLQDNQEKQWYEVYLFGTEQVLGNFINVLTILIIGIAFEEFLQTIVLISAFMGIRSYAGGYHASSVLRCYILTNSVIVWVLFVMKYMPLENTILGYMSLASSVIIFILSPIDTENKRIDEIEYIHYRKRTIIAWNIEVSIALLCAVLQYLLITESIVFAHTILSLSLIGGKISNLYKRKVEFK